MSAECRDIRLQWLQPNTPLRYCGRELRPMHQPGLASFTVTEEPSSNCRVHSSARGPRPPGVRRGGGRAHAGLRGSPRSARRCRSAPRPLGRGQDRGHRDGRALGQTRRQRFDPGHDTACPCNCRLLARGELCDDAHSQPQSICVNGGNNNNHPNTSRTPQNDNRPPEHESRPAHEGSGHGR